MLLPSAPARVGDTLSEHLSVQELTTRPAAGARALAVGEILWDVFADATRLGGAALNFAVHLKRLGHDPRIVSAVGTDARGQAAGAAIASLGLDTTFLQTTARFSTGTASVRLGPGDHTSFVIERPAAYDAVELTDAALRQVMQWTPAWCYYGTLFSSSTHGRQVTAAAAGRAAAGAPVLRRQPPAGFRVARPRRRPPARRACRETE